jgi:NADH-quinone oxidoreductase subunit G
VDLRQDPLHLGRAARQRLDRPYVRGADGKLKPGDLAEAFAADRDGGFRRPEKIGAIAGDLVGVEEMYALKA